MNAKRWAREYALFRSQPRSQSNRDRKGMCAGSNGMPHCGKTKEDAEGQFKKRWILDASLDSQYLRLPWRLTYPRTHQGNQNAELPWDKRFLTRLWRQLLGLNFNSLLGHTSQVCNLR